MVKRVATFTQRFEARVRIVYDSDQIKVFAEERDYDVDPRLGAEHSMVRSLADYTGEYIPSTDEGMEECDVEARVKIECLSSTEIVGNIVLETEEEGDD